MGSHRRFNPGRGVGIPFVLLAIAALLNGCGSDRNSSGGGSPPPPVLPDDGYNYYAYVANNDLSTISAFKVENDGSLTELVAEGSPYSVNAAIWSSWSLEVDPLGRFVYVGNFETVDNTISVYKIDAATGALTEATGSPFASGGDFPYEIAADPTGNFVYVVNTDTPSIGAFSVDADGVLAPIPGHPFPTGAQPEKLVVHPSGDFLYVQNDDGIVGYTIDPATGALAQFGAFPAGVPGMEKMVIDPSGQFLYVADYAQSGDIAAHAIDPITGSLTLVPGSPFATTAPAQSNVWGLAIDPAGKFLYAANNYASGTSVRAFTLDSATGTLTPNAPFSYPIGFELYEVVAHPAGLFLYVVDTRDGVAPGKVTAYSIDATGSLTELASLGSPFDTGVYPTYMKIARVLKP